MSDADSLESLGSENVNNYNDVFSCLSGSSCVSVIASVVVNKVVDRVSWNDEFYLPSIPEIMRPRIVEDLVKVKEFLVQMSGGSQPEFSSIVALLEEAFCENDQRFSEDTALRWADDFKFPYEVYTTDLADFIRLDRDLGLLAKLRQEVSQGDRLSLSRVNGLNLADSEWKERLFKMADGIPIITAPGFVPSNVPPKLRQKYLRLAPAINKSIYELYKNNLIVILPTSVAKDVKGVHFSALHWTLQADKEQGRTLADPSSGGNPLNTPAAKELIDIACGQIVHPTIEDMMSMLISFVEKNGSFEGMTLWKRDMAGAFTLLNILPEYVRLCAFELTDNLTMFYIAGFFGHCSLPSFFNIVTKVAESEIQLAIRGSVCMYVDDVCGVSSNHFLEEDIEKSGKVIIALTGSKSLAVHKDRRGRKVDWIGWGVDLDLESVNVSRKKLLKCLHGFFFTDLEDFVSIKVIEKLASWCSRYAIILPALKPLSVTLHGEHAGMRNRKAKKRLSSEAKLVCWIWRVFLILIALKPDVFSRKIMSFHNYASTIRVEYDASLTGLGLVISRKCEVNWINLKAGSLLVPYNLLGNSSFQNTMEFMAVALSVCIIRALGYSNFGLDLVGDNMSSLSWAKYNRFRRGRSLRATLLFMRVTSTFAMQINFAEHLAGESNVICDALSRGTTPLDLGFIHPESVSTFEFTWIDQFFRLCDPTLDLLHSENEFIEFWNGLSEFCALL